MLFKRILLSLMIGALTLGLCACGSDDAEPAASPSPDAADFPTPEIVSTPRPEDLLPTLEPVSTVAAVYKTSDLAYSTYSIENIGFSMQYPSNWTRIPGEKTICYVEPVAEGELPARIAVSRKAMGEVLTTDKIVSQLGLLLRVVLTQNKYDGFEIGDPVTEGSFIGRDASYVTYTAVKGTDYVKGYIVVCAVGKTIYGYHFSAPSAKYDAMDSVRVYLRDSMQIK